MNQPLSCTVRLLCLLGLAVLSGPRTTHAQAIDVGDLGQRHGRSDAPVQVLEFSDFACDHCRDFHRDSWAVLRDAYVATGKVQWIYVTFASGQYVTSTTAAAVAECAGEQGRFSDMQERLFDGQDDWKELAPDAAGAVFLGYVEALGIDRAALLDCVAAPRVTDRLDRAGALAAQVGVQGTPTYVIDGFPATGSLSADVLAQILDARLAQLGVGR